jgi:hypothetical protein
VAVGVTGRDVEVFEHLALVDQIPGRKRQLAEQSRDDVSPCLLPEREMQALHGHFGGLLRGETGPFVTALDLR